MMPILRHFSLGLLVISAVLWWAGTALKEELAAQSSSIPELAEDVGEWVTGQSRVLSTQSPAHLLVALDDPVFQQQEDGTYRQVGLLVNIDGGTTRDASWEKEFDLEIYQDALLKCPDGYELHYHRTSLSLDSVVRTLAPKERQDEIKAYLAEEWQKNKQQFLLELRPVMTEGIRTALKAVEQELPEILSAHRKEFEAIGDRYETEILKEDLVPLVRKEILPIVQKEASPVVEDVGRDLWKRVSLWGFAWRYVFDQSPLPKKDRVKGEFQRFVREEAVPELESRTDQFIRVTERIVRRSMDNPRVKAVLRENLKQVAEDPELQKLIWNVVRESLIENERLRDSIEDYLKEHETRTVMQIAGGRVEPMIRHIGDILFGTRENGITPEFSRILRLQILQKDRRWFVLVPTDTEEAEDAAEAGSTTAADFVRVVDMQRTPMVYPVGFGGEIQSPLTPQDN